MGQRVKSVKQHYYSDLCWNIVWVKKNI